MIKAPTKILLTSKMVNIKPKQVTPFQGSYCKLVINFCLWFCAITAVYFRSFRWCKLSLMSLICSILLSFPKPNKIYTILTETDLMSLILLVAFAVLSNWNELSKIYIITLIFCPKRFLIFWLWILLIWPSCQFLMKFDSFV